jgi:hypothetical protein
VRTFVQVFVVTVLLGLVMVFFAARADAHRLSGHPKSLQGKLTLAKKQLAHDHRSLQALSSQGWTLLSPIAAFSHRWWLARDRAYVKQLQQAVVPSWLWSAFLCIHRYEGSWTDPNPPYYGGLQMDYGFQSTYGSALLRAKGTADHWTPAEQIAVAIRAYRSGRGFYPWPNTARYCGLI